MPQWNKILRRQIFLQLTRRTCLCKNDFVSRRQFFSKSGIPLYLNDEIQGWFEFKLFANFQINNGIKNPSFKKMQWRHKFYVGFFTKLNNFISPIFYATPIGKFNMFCATPSLYLTWNQPFGWRLKNPLHVVLGTTSEIMKFHSFLETETISIDDMLIYATSTRGVMWSEWLWDQCFYIMICYCFFM